MSDQSEFEKWLDDEINKWPVELYSTDECFMHGARAARDWMLSKAKELSFPGHSIYGQPQNLQIIKLEDLEEACK